MWFRLGAGIVVPGRELVGLFRPERGPGAAAVLRDGRVVASPHSLRVLARRYERAAKGMELEGDGKNR